MQTREKIKIFGNLKFDIELQNYTEEEKSQLKNLIKAEGRKIFTAGSTRTGEDEIIIEAFKKLENYMLVLVPRHLDRIERIENLIKEKNLTYVKYSDCLEKNTEKTDIILVDKMGVLRKFYAVCDTAFVGGTLVNIGGHSLLEPLFYRKTQFLENICKM